MDIREAALVLGVAESATLAEVKEAHRSQARLLHPDRVSEADRATAEAAMVRINQAKEVFEARGNGGSVPVLRRDVLAEFGALLCDRRGWDLNGVLGLERMKSGRVAAYFRSDDEDARGTAIVDEEVSLLPGTKASRDGRLDLPGGGHLIIRGGRLQAERVMAFIDDSGEGPQGGQKVVQFKLSPLVVAAAVAVVALVLAVAIGATFIAGRATSPVVTPNTPAPNPVVTATQPPPVERTVTATATATATATKTEQAPASGRTSAPRSDPARVQSEQDTASQLMRGMNAQDWSFVNGLCDPVAVCQQQFTDFFSSRFARGQWLSVNIGTLYSCATFVPASWESMCSDGSDWLADFTNTCSKNASIGIDEEVARFRFTSGPFPYIRSFESAYAPALPPECA